MDAATCEGRNADYLLEGEARDSPIQGSNLHSPIAQYVSSSFLKHLERVVTLAASMMTKNGTFVRDAFGLAPLPEICFLLEVQPMRFRNTARTRVKLFLPRSRSDM